MNVGDRVRVTEVILGLYNKTGTIVEGHYTLSLGAYWVKPDDEENPYILLQRELEVIEEGE